MDEVTIKDFDEAILDAKRASKNTSFSVDYGEHASLKLGVVVAQLDKTNYLLERMLDLLEQNHPWQPDDH